MREIKWRKKIRQTNFSPHLLYSVGHETVSLNGKTPIREMSPPAVSEVWFDSFRARICRSFKETRYRFSAWRAGTKPYLSYWPARVHRLAKSIPRNRFLGSINVYKSGLSSPGAPTFPKINTTCHRAVFIYLAWRIAHSSEYFLQLVYWLQIFMKSEKFNWTSFPNFEVLVSY